MNVAERRQQLMIYLADLPDTKVNELYSDLKKEINDHSFNLTEDHINILEQRESEYIKGQSKPGPWKEVHERIRNKKKGA